MDCGSSSSSKNNNMNGQRGPCGACKFLRRKCVKGCVFAPFFDSDQGTAHFAAVHRVFGASNAAKLLLRIPPHHRLDAVLTLSYEALSRARDPVYGCVAHIFALQQQVINLQAELAYVQARLSTLQRLPMVATLPQHQTSSSSNNDFPFDPTNSLQYSTFFNPCDLHHDADLQALARDFVSRMKREENLNGTFLSKRKRKKFFLPFPFPFSLFSSLNSSSFGKTNRPTDFSPLGIFSGSSEKKSKYWCTAEKKLAELKMEEWVATRLMSGKAFIIISFYVSEKRLVVSDAFCLREEQKI
ncbi:LOB domain-containing protein 19-like [Prosopis cineraria]|uniref:LOB domain-containing protein 19-like n=1 Tax=Prosopis cineraria TaxID=364024 RepID=UPI00240FBC17|nr:LOB domain-containing protein 19-like [Prosopis cineraria]